VPLSDHEQRLLEQMERALYQEDPKFASSLRSGQGSIDRKRLLTGAGIVVLGLVAVVAGVAIPFAPLGVLGFAGMIGGAYWGWQATTERKGSGARTAAGRSAGGGSPRKTGSSSFMNRMEDRWRRRRESGGN
jgi:hypothetical protein